jgi:formylglycine-generating enzyme required for sulfatase activity
MPDNKAQVILRDLVDRHGPFSSSADDLRRCRGLLLDLAGSHKLEINLLLRALESGAPERLAAGHTTLGLVTPRLARELQETQGISAENAAWSVDAWVFALSLKPAAAEKTQVILRDLVDRYGPFSSSDDDRRRCRRLLRDLVGSYTLEVNLILRALESGAPEQLIAGHNNLGLVTPRLARALQETQGISAENAAWAVDAWVFALGLKTAAEQERQRIAAEQARQAAARAEEEKRRQEAAEQERQRIAAEQARQAAAARAAEERRRREAAEQERQRAAAGSARRQQTAPTWQQIGIELVQIPTGEFLYGDDKRRVYLPEYWIAKTPVTNRQYKAFVDATRHRTPPHWKSGKIPVGKEDHPIVYVSWHDAAAFCQWAGVALPSEQQWEKAARGTDGRKYPWGAAEPDKHRCNFNRDVGDTTPVGKYPAGANGLFDMAGNVWEWCADWYEQGGRVMRGGSWLVSARWVRCAYRDWSNPGSRYDSVGFRVVSPAS